MTPLPWVISDSVLDFLFIIDMILNFFTAIENDNGEVTVDRKKIALIYFKGWFLVDLTSSVPITLIQELIQDVDSAQ